MLRDEMPLCEQSNTKAARAFPFEGHPLRFVLGDSIEDFGFWERRAVSVQMNRTPTNVRTLLRSLGGDNESLQHYRCSSYRKAAWNLPHRAKRLIVLLEDIINRALEKDRALRYPLYVAVMVCVPWGRGCISTLWRRGSHLGLD